MLRIDRRDHLLGHAGGTGAMDYRVTICIELRRVQVAMAIGQHCAITDSPGPNQ